jgi:hypothetical protein
VLQLRSFAVKSLLDPTFRYVPSSQTDLRKTFARVRREMRQPMPAAEPLPRRNLSVLYSREKRTG